MSPKDSLLAGAKILEPVLTPAGFVFRFGKEQKNSGGKSASGKFVRGDRLLELHFRHTLGLVRYHAADLSVSHEFYMRALGKSRECLYPGFSHDPLDTFRELAHDLKFAEDFLRGSAEVLARAAAQEAASDNEKHDELMAGYVGDKTKLSDMRTAFHETRYGDVVKLSEGLKYPERMSASDRRMMELAHKRQ